MGLQETLLREAVLIDNLLTNAFEGGSNYWYMIEDHNKDDIKECEYLSNLLSFEGSRMLISHQEEPKGKEVTHLDVLKAWQKFKTDPKYAKHYHDTINENDDGNTADIFLQLVVIGDVIYA